MFWTIKEPGDEYKFHAKMRELAEWWGLNYEERGRFHGVLPIYVRDEPRQINCVYMPNGEWLLFEYARATGFVLAAQVKFCWDPETIAERVAEQLFSKIGK